jgi:hypothetical protein
MKTKIVLLLTAFLIISPEVSNGQIGSKLKDKLNKALNKPDSSANKNQGEDQATESKPRGLGGLLGGKTDIVHDDEYSFTGRIYMVMETYDKKDVSKSDFFTYFNASTANAGIEVAIENPDNKDASIPTRFIFDNDNRCFMILMENEGSKTGIISTIPSDSAMAAKAKNQKTTEVKPATITKTGNTRMIAGYKCEEYKVVEEGEDGYANVWMTKDVKIKADKKNWGKAGMPTYYGYPEFEGSMMLAMEGYDKDNKPEMKMETKEINENFKHSISTVGYSLLKMNFGQAGKK